MYPPERKKTEFEQVATDDWIIGEISKVEYNENYKRIWKGEEKVGPAVRLHFTLEGYQYPKYSGWMSFSYGEKANLYTKYISSLVEDAKPDMVFNLDQLQDMKVKIMFKQQKEYQNVELIRPLEKKVIAEKLPF